MEWPDGVWRRLSVEVRGSDPCEVSEVWWLQCGRYFADVRRAVVVDTKRLPYSATQAFAGEAVFDAGSGVMEWVARLDSEDRADAERDVARLCPCEGNPRVMREDGDTYTEYWGRMDVGDVQGKVSETESSLRVEIGPYAITVERTGSLTFGTLYVSDGSRWIARLSTRNRE